MNARSAFLIENELLCLKKEDGFRYADGRLGRMVSGLGRGPIGKTCRAVQMALAKAASLATDGAPRRSTSALTPPSRTN